MKRRSCWFFRLLLVLRACVLHSIFKKRLSGYEWDTRVDPEEHTVVNNFATPTIWKTSAYLQHIAYRNIMHAFYVLV